MTWLKEHISILLIALGQFIAPASALFVLLQAMVVGEYILSQSIRKEEKDFQKINSLDALIKAVGFIMVIFLGLICDEAFHIKAENIQVLVRMGLAKQVTPITYLLAMLCIIYEGKCIDKVWKKRYKASLLDQINFLPGLLTGLGIKKK